MQGGDSPALFGMDYEDTDLEEVTDDERKKRKKKTLVLSVFSIKYIGPDEL